MQELLNFIKKEQAIEEVIVTGSTKKKTNTEEEPDKDSEDKKEVKPEEVKPEDEKKDEKN